MCDARLGQTWTELLQLQTVITRRRERISADEEERNRVDALCKLRDQKADTLGLENSVLGSRATLEGLVMPAEGELPSRLMPWQREQLGL